MFWKNSEGPRFARGGYVPKSGPPPLPPGTPRESLACRDAYTEFYQRYAQDFGRSILNRFGTGVATLARSAFYAGWIARKNADLLATYGGSPPPTEATVEAVLRAILAHGPRTINDVRERAATAGIPWPALRYVAERVCSPWPWPCVHVTHWTLAENDFDSFLDAGIPNG